MSLNKFMNSTIIDEDMEYIYQFKKKWNQLYNKTILITGATGMLASYIVFFIIYLNERYNANITIIAQVRNKNKASKLFKKYIYEEYFILFDDDILKPITIDHKIDYIIHAASLASPQYYEELPVEVAAPNVVGTYNVLELAVKNKISGMIFFSSGDVYGKMPQGIGSIHEDMMGVTDPLDKHSCYGESKRMGETFCMCYAREYGVPVNIARIAHTYSPTMDIYNDPRVFSSFMRCVYEGTDIVLLSDGRAKRPFCYIADAVVGFLLILLNNKYGQAYNVSNSSNFISILELANILSNLRQDKKLSVLIKQRKKDDTYLENKDNIENSLVENKLRSIGWECNFNVREGFSRVYAYLVEQSSI